MRVQKQFESVSQSPLLNKIGLQGSKEDSPMPSDYLPAVDDVLSVIRYLGQQNAAIELTKSFRGLVLQQDVRVLEVYPDDAAFRITNTETCAAMEGDVYLHSRLFPKPVKAQIKSLNLDNGMLVLSGFAYIDIEWKKRQHERVRPKQPTYITLHWKGKSHRACMDNISVNGMGVLAYKIFERGMSIQPGSKAQLEFQLSPDQISMALKGTIIYINKIGRYLTKIGIRLFPTVRESRLLKEYIAPRKQEILEELDQAYWEMKKPRGIETLYF
jgi:hypothetical protein